MTKKRKSRGKRKDEGETLSKKRKHPVEMVSVSTQTEQEDISKSQTIEKEASQKEEMVEFDVPTNRKEEIKEFLQLFGYKEDRTVITVYEAGKIGGGKAPQPVEGAKGKKKKIGTFIIIGRTHDSEFLKSLNPPAKESSGGGYVGFLSKASDANGMPPHEKIPLDFTPINFTYPEAWKKEFKEQKSYLLGLHVPSSFAEGKKQITRKLYRLAKTNQVQDSWSFLKDLKPLSYENFSKQEKEKGKTQTESA